MDKQATRWGDILRETFEAPTSGLMGGLGKGVAKGMIYPALGIGGGLAAGVGIPYGTYKLMSYLGEKGKQQTLEKQIQLSRLHNEMLKQQSMLQTPQTKLSSEVLMRGYGLLGQQQFQKIAAWREGQYDAMAHLSPSHTETTKVPDVQKTLKTTKRPFDWKRAGKWGLGVTGVGLGSYGLYNLLKGSPQPQYMPQYMPMPQQQMYRYY